MAGSLKHYLACANTSKGFINFFASNLQDMDKVFILKGGPGTGKSTLMKRVGTYYRNMGYDIEYIHCSSDLNSLDGVIIRKIGVAIVDGTAPHVIEPTAPGALEEYVHLGIAWDTELLAKSKDEILHIQNEISACYKKAYASMAKALLIHDEWEKIYIDHMDFEKANEFAKSTAAMILPDLHGEEIEALGREMHRFFGASTPTGPVDYIDNITEDYHTRYFILGRPGTGKSTMLKTILASVVKAGYDVEVYHCAFDPDSLDMLCIPDLDTCIFDSTSPHEHFPCQKGDIIIDVYSELVTPGTDEAYAEEISNIVSRYKATIEESRSYLSVAKMLHDQLERYYVDATNFDLINEIREDVVNKIERLRKNKI